MTLPFADADYPERYEGMLVRFPQSLVIAEYFNYDRFGEIVLAQPLAGEPRPFTRHRDRRAGRGGERPHGRERLSRITLDDDQSAQNPPVLRHPNGQPFSLDQPVPRRRHRRRTRSACSASTSASTGSIPTGPADYTAANPRPAAPEPVGGTLRVAAMNTLNFFVTLDTDGERHRPRTRAAATQNLDCRGADADQPDEFTRQRDKLLAALAGLERATSSASTSSRTRPASSRSTEHRRPQRHCPGLRLHRHRHDRHRRDQGRPDLPARRRHAGRRVQDPDVGGRPAVHRHEEPAVARADLRGERHRRALHGRRQPPQVEGLRLQRRRRPRPRRRPGQLQPDPPGAPPRRSSTGSRPTRPAAATPTS